MTDDTPDTLRASLEASCEAFGFVLAAALLERRDLSTVAGLKGFAVALNDLTDTERFSPDVAESIAFIVGGIAARLQADGRPDADEFL